MTRRAGRFLKTVFLVGQLAAVTVLTSGWTNQLGGAKVESPYASQLTADSNYMMGLLKNRGPDVDSMPIDLADPRQYQFMMNRLLVAGKTPINSPYLFQRISEMRAKALAGPTKGVSPSPATDSGFKCTHLLLPGVGTTGTSPGKMQYNDDRPVVTCEGGAEYVYADIAAYDTNADSSQEKFLVSNSGEDYGGGTDFDSVLIAPQIAAGVGRFLKNDSMIIAYDSTGAERTSYAVVSTAVLSTSARLTLSHPVQQALADDPADTGYIYLCQQRGGTECDYAMGSKDALTGKFMPGTASPNGYEAIGAKTGGAWSGDPSTFIGCDTGNCDSTYLGYLYVPMEGAFEAGTVTGKPPCTITSYDNASLILIKSEPETGGSCQVTNDFKGKLTTGSTKTGYHFIANFTNRFNEYNTCTLNYVQNNATSLAISIRAQTTCGPVLLGLKDPDPGTATYRGGPKLKFLNSCLAEGTRVLLADGSSQPIEQVKVGAQVLANDSGLVLTVTGFDRGAEGHPLVVLRDDKGHSIRMTEKHPVLDAKGRARPAVDVKVGDQLAYKGGLTRITQIDRVPYQGQVYNLALGTPEELAKAGKKTGTLFADGFLVGDKAMQRELESVRPPASDRLSHLSKGWRRDLNNAMARTQPVK